MSSSLFLVFSLNIQAQTLNDGEAFAGTYEITEVCAIAPAGDAEFRDEDIFEDNGYFLLSIEVELNEGNNLKLSVVEVLGPCSLPENLRAKSTGAKQFQINETIVSSIDSALNQYVTGKGLLKDGSTLELEYLLLVANSCEAAVCRSKGKKVTTPIPTEKSNPPTEANVYSDIRQNFVVFEGLQGKTLQFELFDISGRQILKANTNGSPVQIPGLSNGIYPYRLHENGTLLQTGKILKGARNG